MSKMPGTKNTIERSDAKRSREAIMKACKSISGSQVTARQIAEMMEHPVHPANVNVWLRRLEAKGFIKVKGSPFNKYGKVITVIE